MQQILLKIFNAFLVNKFISRKYGLKIINKILIENNEEKLHLLDIDKNMIFNLENHLKNINDLRNYFSKKISNNILIENKINETLAEFIPSQKKINSLFVNENKYKQLSLLSLLSYYIKTDKNELNVNWNYKSKYGNLNISINNAKPEKTQEQIILEKNFISKNKNEPKCPICIENIGFKGSFVKDSRENLRVIFSKLADENSFFFQYSPYAYVNNHFVLNNINHTPMVINNKTINNLIMFIESNDKFFLGSNADLSIVGGSILGHNHYQGGEDRLPIMDSKFLSSFIYRDSEINILNWPLNVIKVSNKNKEEIIRDSNFFINSWKCNSDYGLNSLNNSVTIITHKENNIFISYLIFRNNETTKERVFGKFHIEESKFHIKQENIGLMEAAGLAILPKRLINEVSEILEMFNSGNIDKISENHSISKHEKWIKNIIKNKITITEKSLLNEIAKVFVSCLEDCKVLGDNAFSEFIKKISKNNQEIFKIKNNVGLDLELISKGFTFKQIKVNNENFLLEYEDVDSYFNNNDIFLNSFVGPVAGRIESGIVKFNNKKVVLKTDSNDNYMHGMNEKWSDLEFDIQITSLEEFYIIEGCTKTYNREQNCTYEIKIILTIWKFFRLINIEYLISSNKEAICNPTHHFYWKIPENKNIFNLNINLRSVCYWDLNSNFNPIKKNFWIHNDFLKIDEIKQKIGEKQSTLVGGGVDHPIELVGESRIILTNEEYKYSVISDSTLKNIVMYTQNWKSSNKLLSSTKDTHQAICIEYQEIPTSIKNPNFEKITINKNKQYSHNTTYKFEIK